MIPSQALSAVRMRPLVRAWRALPAVLAFAILAVQVWIPWSVPHLGTNDGSAHVYSAVIARELLFDPHSAYRSLFEFQKSVVPNWGATIFLNVILSFVGVDNAEKLLMSLCIAIGFFCFSYCVHSLAPTVSPWTPISNFVLQNWLLWQGYYNFYLGTMLGLLVIGSYVGHANRLSIRRAGVLSLALVAVFFTHLMAASVTALALVTISVWMSWVRPVKSGLRQLSILVGMVLPIVVLFVFFARSVPRFPWPALSMAVAWTDFPLHLFTTGIGSMGSQSYLWPAVLGYIALATAAMQRSEWTTARGGLALAAFLSFLAYLLIPDGGVGGGFAKIRFAWAIFVLGGLVAVSVLRLQRFRIPFALYVAGFLIANLVATTHSLWASSAAVEEYLSALDQFPAGARIIRLRYPTPDIPERYGYHAIWRDPLFRVDSLAAARCRCIDLADYQAATRIFPIVYNATVDRGQQQGWGVFDAPDRSTSERLRWLFENAPGPPDYVILTVDRLSPPSAFRLVPDYPRVLATLNEFGMEITPKSRSAQFVRVYKRTESR
jgi:hypothetical protein